VACEPRQNGFGGGLHDVVRQTIRKSIGWGPIAVTSSCGRVARWPPTSVCENAVVTAYGELNAEGWLPSRHASSTWLPNKRPQFRRKLHHVTNQPALLWRNREVKTDQALNNCKLCVDNVPRPSPEPARSACYPTTNTGGSAPSTRQISQRGAAHESAWLTRVNGPEGDDRPPRTA
jgi:hypothetical protein